MAKLKKRSTRAARGRIRVRGRSAPYRAEETAPVKKLRHEIDVAVEKAQHLRDEIAERIGRARGGASKGRTARHRRRTRSR